MAGAATNTTPALETSRLLLRPLRMAGANQLQAPFPHWGVVQYLAAAIPWPYPGTGARDVLKATLPKNADGRQYDGAMTLTH